MAQNRSKWRTIVNQSLRLMTLCWLFLFQYKHKYEIRVCDALPSSSYDLLKKTWYCVNKDTYCYVNVIVLKGLLFPSHWNRQVSWVILTFCDFVAFYENPKVWGCKDCSNKILTQTAQKYQNNDCAVYIILC